MTDTSALRKLLDWAERPSHHRADPDAAEIDMGDVSATLSASVDALAQFITDSLGRIETLQERVAELEGKLADVESERDEAQELADKRADEIGRLEDRVTELERG